LTEQNEEKQLRRNHGQVLRYRHLLSRGGKQVRAVLVAEREPSDHTWLQLCEDVGVVLVWPETLATYEGISLENRTRERFRRLERGSA